MVDVDISKEINSRNIESVRSSTAHEKLFTLRERPKTVNPTPRN